MKIKKYKCVTNNNNISNREIGGIYDCIGLSFDGTIGIILNRNSKMAELWAMEGMEEVKED